MGILEKISSNVCKMVVGGVCIFVNICVEYVTIRQEFVTIENATFSEQEFVINTLSHSECG